MKTGELVATMISARKMNLDDFFLGFGELITYWEDLIIDIPLIWQYFAEDIGKFSTGYQILLVICSFAIDM